MPRPSKGKSLKQDIERVGWRETSLNASALILSVVKEAAALAPFQELRRAASAALIILQTIQAVKDNKEAYERLGDDSGGLVVAIWRSYKKAEVPNEWLSTEMREILADLTHTLDNISSFVQEQLSRNKAIRVIFSRADTAKINEYREHLNYAMQKFELQSHMNINDVLMQLMRLSEQILHRGDEDDVKRTLEFTAREAREWEEAEKAAEKAHEEELKTVKEISALERLKQLEIDNQAEDETWHSDKLKQIEKEAKKRQSELERLRAAASALELANRLKKTQEEEIALLKRQLAAEERSSSQSSKRESSTRRSEIEEEEEWEGNLLVEEASSEEEEIQLPVRSSKVKKKPSGSPKRRPASLNDEDLQPRKGSNMRTGRRKLSSTSLRVDESTDDSDEEEYYAPPPPKNSPKVKRKPQSSSRSPPRDVDDMTAQFRGFTPWGQGSPHWTGSNSRSSSPMYLPMYGSPPPMENYGYMPGMVFNSGVGNISNSTISNVGNNNSVTKVYHTPRTRSQRRS